MPALACWAAAGQIRPRLCLSRSRASARPRQPAGTESCEIRSKLRYSRFPETLISRSRQGPGQVVMCAVISRLNFNSGSEGGCRNLAIITKITLTPCYLFLMTRWAALGPGPGLRTLFKMFSLTFNVITAPARDNRRLFKRCCEKTENMRIWVESECGVPK